MTSLVDCPGCSDAGLLACNCAYYADWPTAKPSRIQRRDRHPGLFYRDGHSAGRSDACRRLWKHLSPEGRVLAAAIATEGGERLD